MKKIVTLLAAIMLVLFHDAQSSESAKRTFTPRKRTALEGWYDLPPSVRGAIKESALNLTKAGLIGGIEVGLAGSELEGKGKPFYGLAEDLTDLTGKGLFDLLDYKARVRTSEALKETLNPFDAYGELDLDKLHKLAIYVRKDPSIFPILVKNWELDRPQAEFLYEQIKQILRQRSLSVQRAQQLEENL